MACLVLSSLVVGCGVSRQQATIIASEEVRQYSSEVGLSSDDFGSPKIGSEGGVWMFDYSTTSPPRHLLRIYIRGVKSVEVHKLIEDN
jgi:hypothetical protein